MPTNRNRSSCRDRTGSAKPTTLFGASKKFTTHMKRNGTTAAPIADFFVKANPADRPMIVAKVKNMPTTATKNNGRRPNLSTLTEEVVATIRLKTAAWRLGLNDQMAGK
jgi:hypothetical protein